MEGNALRCPLLGKVFAVLKYQKAIPMVKVQLLKQDLLISMLPVDHYQHSVNYILLCHTTPSEAAVLCCNTTTSHIDS